MGFPQLTQLLLLVTEFGVASIFTVCPLISSLASERFGRIKLIERSRRARGFTYTVHIQTNGALVIPKVVPFYTLTNYKHERSNQPCWSECWFVCLFRAVCPQLFTEGSVNGEMRAEPGGGRGGTRSSLSPGCRWAS